MNIFKDNEKETFSGNCLCGLFMECKAQGAIIWLTEIFLGACLRAFLQKYKPKYNIIINIYI